MRDRAVAVIGLDLGTRECRAALVAADGRVVHVARRATPTRRTRDGGFVHPPGPLLRAATAVIAECTAAARAPVAAIGIAGMAEAGTALDSRRRPVGPLLAWYDPRPAAAAADIAAEVGTAALFARTGTRPQAKHPLARLRWLAGVAPETARRAHGWAGVPELVALRLTGALGTNASLASRTQLFDVGRRRWDADLVALGGLVLDGMPTVLPGAFPVGGLRRGPAQRLGLAAGTPVFVAGHDHVVAGVAAGATRPGRVLDSMGSAEMALLVTRAPILREEVRLAGFSTGCHAIDGIAYVAGGLQASGALVDWFAELAVRPASGPERPGQGDAARGATRDAGPPGRAAPTGDSALPGGALAPPGDAGQRYEQLDRLLQGRRIGPTGIAVRPYLRGRTGPAPDPGATLDIVGLRPGDDVATIGQAILEGASFHVRWMLEELAAVAGRRVREVRVVGGGTRNRTWLAIKAAVSPWPTRVVPIDEAAAIGAATVAARSLGITLAGTGDDAPLVRLVSTPGLRARYDAAYRDWSKAARGG